MIFSKIWERYLIQSNLKFMLSFLFGIFILYSIVDFFSHSTRLFTYNDLPFFSLLLYYFYQFVLLLPIFLPLSFMLSLIKVLSDMNFHKELISLQMAGISSKKLSKPLFAIALLLSCLLFFNYQILFPKASQYKEQFKNSYMKKKRKKLFLHQSTLQNGSKIVYQKKLDDTTLFDLYWMTKDKVWHIKTLDISKSPPVGYFVESFEKDKNNLLQRVDSFEQYSFPNMPITPNLFKGRTYENSSISSLFHLFFQSNFLSKKQKNILSSQLTYKLFMPLFPLLLVLALFPLCIRYSKNRPTFYIILFSLIGFFIFYTLMDSILILSENLILNPFFATGSLFFLLLVLFGIDFFKDFYDRKIKDSIINPNKLKIK